MRTIKFRGKRIDTGEWVHGYYIGKLEKYPEDEYVIIVDEYNGIEHEVYPKTVGQYIGLKDKNKKEIYEGDIVKYYGSESIVEYINGAFVLVNKKMGRQYPLYKLFFNEEFDDIEIIGNIHKNT